MHSMAFDFGAGHQLPPRRAPFRSFFRYADFRLLDYLDQRRVSHAFLREIDAFLECHPELARWCPEWTANINQPDILTAYRCFMVGYTRPARFVDMPDARTWMPPPEPPMSLLQERDPELEDFFHGQEFRWDVLRKIDHDVALGFEQWRRGIRMSIELRKLVILAYYGQVADIYKYYEYNYQTEFLPHRYVPEHVILSFLPKTTHPLGPDYDRPNPRTLPIDEEFGDEVLRSHPGTRARIARACDAGMDVIPVLLDDFRIECLRSGLGRRDTAYLTRKASQAIEYERDIQGGRDIVEMVMSMAPPRMGGCRMPPMAPPEMRMEAQKAQLQEEKKQRKAKKKKSRKEARRAQRAGIKQE